MNCSRQKLQTACRGELLAKTKIVTTKRAETLFREAHTKHTVSNTGMIGKRKGLKILWPVVSMV